MTPWGTKSYRSKLSTSHLALTSVDVIVSGALKGEVVLVAKVGARPSQNGFERPIHE